MSSRPRRSTLAPSRFSPTHEESPKIPSAKSSQSRQQSTPIKDSQPVKKSPVKKENPLRQSLPANNQPKVQPIIQPAVIQPAPQQEPKVPILNNQPNDPSLFISKAGRLSIPSSKLSPLSFANFGRKCLNNGANLTTINPKRRSLFEPQVEPIAKKARTDVKEPLDPISISEEVPTDDDVQLPTPVIELAENVEESENPKEIIEPKPELPDESLDSNFNEPEEIPIEPMEIMEDRKSPIPKLTITFNSSKGPNEEFLIQTPPIRGQATPSLLEGRKSRNKSKPLSELAPDLLPNRFSVGTRQIQQKEKQEAQLKKRTEVDAKRIEREIIRAKKDQERALRIQQEEQIEKLPLAIPDTPVDQTPPSLPSRSARKSLSIKIEDFDSESSIGRRSSKSISSPAVFGKRYQAFGTRAPDSLLGNSRFYTRMDNRKHQNPLACGLVPIKHDSSTNDYYYREVLIRKPPVIETEEENQDIDILTDDASDLGISRIIENDDELLVKNPAFDCVVDIRSVIPGPMEIQNDEDQAPIIDQILEHCEREESVMNVHLKVLVSSIVSQRLVDLNTINVVGGCSLFYSQTLKNATRLRDRLCLFTEKRIYGIEDAHAFLLQRLSDEHLASYLNLLRYLKVSGSSLTMHLLDHPVDSEIQSANEFIREFVNTKIIDPNLRHGKCMDIVPLSNVSLVLVYPQVSMASQTVVKHAHENMFRNLLPAAVRCVEKVELKFDVDVDPRTLTHMCLALIRERVQELVKRRPDDHVFLAGWGISCLLNMQAIQKVQGVTGVLNFAFPLRSYFGFRGSVDDTICVSYCPSLFVVGDSASNVSLKELQQMRENMICESGVVAVGGADSNLYVSPLFLSVERVSQHCVDRIILEHVIDFMKQLINEGGMSAKERRQYLKPVKFPSVFDVDLNTLKGRASGFVPKLRQPKDAKKPKEKTNQSSNPPTPLSTTPSTSTLPSPSLSGLTTFHRQPPPLLSVASSSSLSMKPAQRLDLYGTNELHGARAIFDNALHRRASHAPVAVCMSEPKIPINMPPMTTTAPMIIKRPQPPVNEIQKMMSQEAEQATASLSNFFTNENEDVDDPFSL